MRALSYLTRLAPSPPTGPGTLTPPRRPVTLPSDLVDPDDPALHPFTTGRREPDPGRPSDAGSPGTGAPPEVGTAPAARRRAARPAADHEVRSLQDSGWWDDAPGPGAAGPRPTVRPGHRPTVEAESADEGRWPEAGPAPQAAELRPAPHPAAPPTPRRVPALEEPTADGPADGAPAARPSDAVAPPAAPARPVAPDLTPRSWEWATGEPLDLGLLPPATTTDPAGPGEGPPPLPAAAVPDEAPALDRGPQPRTSVDPEPRGPSLTIGSIEVTVVPPPPPAPAVVPPPPALVMAPRPPDRPTRTPVGSWYGMAQS